MSEEIRRAVIESLRRVRDPERGSDIVSLGIVSDIVVSNGRVMFAITADPARAAAMEPVRAEAEQAAMAVPGVTGAAVVLTAEAVPGVGTRRPGAPASPAGGPQSPMAPRRPAAAGKAGVPGVEAIVAVASGKGGVGKSTTAVNLALALVANGLRVGLLDADIYGPSVPRLMGLRGRPEIVSGRTMRPMERYGLKVMSIGFLVEEETPMIWRGPMVISALTQMLREVAWGELDVLVVDMPPGTGDAQLTMAQQVPLAGAVIVSTPQDLALIDAKKAVDMLKRTGVPLLGLVENMSYFIAPDTGARYDIFGHGGAKAASGPMELPFLGEVPLVMAIRETSDAGQPVVATHPEGPEAEAFRAIARRVLEAHPELRAGG